MDLSVIVVNHNTRQLLVDCLNSVYDTLEGHSFEVLVVDNASTDGSQEVIKERFPQAILIACPLNLGFACANNLAIKRARGRYLLFLNSDAAVEPAEDLGRDVFQAEESHPFGQLKRYVTHGGPVSSQERKFRRKPVLVYDKPRPPARNWVQRL